MAPKCASPLSSGPTWELCFIWQKFFKTEVWEAASQVTLRELLQGGEVGKPGYTEVCNKGQGSQTSKLFLWIKENQISQLKDCSALLCMGRCKSLGSLESFLSYASQLSGASILHFHILSYSELTVGSGCSLMAARLQVFFSFVSALRA